MYRRLEPDRIVLSLATLTRRIEERFPGAGLVAVCGELAEVARQSEARSAEIARPHLGTRLVVTAVMTLCGLLLGWVGWMLLRPTKAGDDLFGTLQGIDAGFNLLVLMGAALFFMLSLEERGKRRRTLAALHELRSIVHVIDMHQLTKDPAATIEAGQPTPSSPKRTLTPYELTRYLDYCSEMLSLAAKVAALYAQSFPDAVVADAVSDIERLTTNLSQKIWQKIMIVENRLGTSAQLAAAAGALQRDLAPVSVGGGRGTHP